MTTLPRSTDVLRGLRAARWTRESTPGQLDNSGPAAQRFEQDEAIEKLGLVDTGYGWEAGHSGWKASEIAASAKWAEMLERAGRDYDVLVVAYVSRFCRNVDVGTTIREQLHAAGATIYFADERILLSDDDDWKRWIDLLVEAEHFSRNLKRTMERTYRSKFRTHKDPGGMYALGFRRSHGEPSVLEVNPDTIGRPVAAFERYALGNISTDDLAVEFGMHPEAVKPMLRNRVYNGWVQRYGQWEAAAWRANPPVSDELWDRVQTVRESRNRGTAPRRKDVPDLLDGLLYCADCGQRLWSDGIDGSGARRKRHRAPCPAWGQRERVRSATWEDPISAQLAALDLSPETIAEVTAALGAPPDLPNEIGAKAMERDRRALADRYAKGVLTEAQFLAEAGALSELQRTLEAVTAPSGISADVAIERLRGWKATWAAGTTAERANIVHATYERIEVRRDEFIAVTLTPHAARCGLALALPETVTVSRLLRVGGEGLEPPTPSV